MTSGIERTDFQTCVKNSAKTRTYMYICLYCLCINSILKLRQFSGAVRDVIIYNDTRGHMYRFPQRAVLRCEGGSGERQFYNIPRRRREDNVSSIRSRFNEIGGRGPSDDDTPSGRNRLKG